MRSFTGPLEDAPGLCDTCRSDGACWQAAYMELLSDEAAAEARAAAAHAACRDCHSGGAAGPVLCENGECPVTYARLACSSRVQAAGRALRRMDLVGW